MEEKNNEISPEYFLSSLSHEIRTPLNGIVGYTQLLAQTKLDHNQKKYINSMTQCSLQLVELLNDILDFSKLSSGKTQINSEYFNIKELFDEVNCTINYKIKEKKQHCHFVYDKNIPEYIVSDKQKIMQILINLLSNAVKFSHIGARIIVTTNLLKNNMIEISVEDNGIGIDKDDQFKLFNPFIQVEQSSIKNGCGLGLAISKKLIEILGGTIYVESEKNKGSVFFFTFKYEQYEKFEESFQKNIILLKDKYILIVDNDIDNRLSISEIFFEYDIKPIVCSSSKETLRIISCKRYPFSVCLIDICMPDISGVELSKKIKEIDADIPLVALTSIDRDFNTTNFKYVLTKPINKIKLMDVILKIVKSNSIEQFKLNPIIKNIENKNINFLIAEDVDYNYEILKNMLLLLGYNNIQYAKNGEEVIDMIQVNKFNILLLDLKMPIKNGFEVAKYIKENSQYNYIKIIVISASVLEYDKEKCKELGISYFLTKPLNLNHLKNTIVDLI